MNNQQLDDLKQFILATVSQSQTYLVNKIEGVEVRLDAKIDGVEVGLNGKIDSLRSEMYAGFSGVAEAIEGVNDRADLQQKGLKKLKSQIKKFNSGQAAA